MKYHIKCPSCHELIEVKSEYMVMCPRCQKKLPNSFREWSAKNLGSSYSDYLSEVCVSESAISGLADQRKLTRKISMSRNLKRLTAALLVAVVAIAAGVGGYLWYKDSQKGASINSIIEQGWKMKYYDDLQATIKFPYELKSKNAISDSVVTADSTQSILSSVSRSWVREGVVAINAAKIEFAPALGVNREVATEQLLRAMVQDNEMKAFEFVPSDYNMSQGGKARMFSGSYLIKAEAYQFRAVMIVRKDNVWYFMVAYPRSKPEGTLLAEKLFTGILIQSKT